jgi:hypoxanthine-DNA glycosylase
LLILGSMPGVASLKAQQYYAHPQNLFWKFLGNVFGFDPAISYEDRAARLALEGVAVWDVLASCVREGSLDADIDHASAVPNDFAQFFAQHPLIERVCFNGGTAAKIFRQRVAPGLPAGLPLQYIPLPSTSPANASIPLTDKARQWAAALQFE